MKKENRGEQQTTFQYQAIHRLPGGWRIIVQTLAAIILVASVIIAMEGRPHPSYLRAIAHIALFVNVICLGIFWLAFAIQPLMKEQHNMKNELTQLRKQLEHYQQEEHGRHAERRDKTDMNNDRFHGRSVECP